MSSNLTLSANILTGGSGLFRGPLVRPSSRLTPSRSVLGTDLTLFVARRQPVSRRLRIVSTRVTQRRSRCRDGGRTWFNKDAIETGLGNWVADMPASDRLAPGSSVDSDI